MQSDINIFNYCCSATYFCVAIYIQCNALFHHHNLSLSVCLYICLSLFFSFPLPIYLSFSVLLNTIKTAGDEEEEVLFVLFGWQRSKQQSIVLFSIDNTITVLSRDFLKPSVHTVPKFADNLMEESCPQKKARRGVFACVRA